MYRKRDLSNKHVVDVTYYRVTPDNYKSESYVLLEVRFMKNKEPSKYVYTKWVIEKAGIRGGNIDYHFNNVLSEIQNSTEREFVQALNDATFWLGQQ